MRIMGLDVGSKTVGVAVSDLLGWTAQGVEIIRINEDQEEYGLERLAQLVKKYQVEKFVVGFPKNMNNSIGERAEKSRNYGNMIAEKFNLPVDYIDERLTTVQASRMLIEEGDVSRQKRHQVIDELAAVMILQNYLDRLSYQNSQPHN
ncbi:MAG: Holliday junction resolvase RuvX [Lactobacillus sp.]|uniref:Putative pre-16S rRNA nuclease n=1 Tax=Bombilactobacillus bombi TaxID=1303590 RepID=A0A347SQ98_9LACO|nr:Holliday junction resolvase RuvX [Bombilactobacillus bombi]MCO6541443.1 Holliday junction resolvase RuvX [Lactobacillus sp.]AXX64207.1 Holliday junction resolvase RuvX [Bombilactobacillus bombi]MCO6543573.1 Holliday junction resolvase RuvX [Lactobacillus sp.]RHW44160.1 Holliday junction resolvase RuvX [Bombilactobacillus bombi]RHW51789.1 Holliday junction resolvase RuvX [Bombilactobacillus bombi]